MFALMGFRCNRCYIIPSADLVITRLGSGPKDWDEGKLVEMIADAIQPDDA